MVLSKVIEKRIKENLKKKIYMEQFGKEAQSLIADNIDELVAMTLEDNEVEELIDCAIEDSIRVMIINK